VRANLNLPDLTALPGPLSEFILKDVIEEKSLTILLKEQAKVIVDEA